MSAKRFLAMAAILCTAAASGAAHAQEPLVGSVPWIADAQQALSLARQSGKPIVVFITSSHCGYCRKMERDTWADPRIIESIRRRAIPLRVSAESQPELARKFGARAFPTTLVFAPDGKNIGVKEGYLAAAELAELIR